MKNIVTKGRKSLARATLAVGVAMGFASPAQAETVTLVCEGEMMTEAAAWSEVYDIDYAAGTVKTKDYTRPAVITDREITFTLRSPHHTFLVRIDRRAGTINTSSDTSGPLFRGRCRPASTSKF